MLDDAAGNGDLKRYKFSIEIAALIEIARSTSCVYMSLNKYFEDASFV
jgi:hypothetical protein